jgi:hypothetical protein
MDGRPFWNWIVALGDGRSKYQEFALFFSCAPTISSAFLQTANHTFTILATGLVLVTKDHRVIMTECLLAELGFLQNVLDSKHEQKGIPMCSLNLRLVSIATDTARNSDGAVTLTHLQRSAPNQLIY